MAASILAFVSCLHVVLAVVRQHRSAPGTRRLVLLCAGYAFAAAPWVWPSASGIVIGLTAHLTWLLATDSLAHASPAERPPRESVRRTAAPAATATPAPVRPPVPRGFVPLTVLTVVQETPDICTFRLGRAAGFDFAPGQFLPVRLRVDGTDHVRCYSISSAPESRGFLEISVKRQGVVSAALHATLRPGATLHARPPAGAFVYPARDDRPLVLFGAGVGITPLMSMLRHALHVEPQRPVVLVQSASCAEGLAFADELRVLQRRHPQFRWLPAVTRGEAGREYYPGRIDRGLIEIAAPGVAGSIACICGPAAMIDHTRDVLLSMGVPRPQIRFELFEAAVAAVGTDAAPDSEAPAGDAPPLVTFARSRQQAPAPPGQSLLEIAERSGVAIPSICRAGVCGTCRTRITTGDVHCRSTTLADDEAAEGYVLACVAHARTDCTVDA